MGPLYPFGVISAEFNYIVALFIGFAFGWVLEQAGFSTSRKLVGVFYGYDYVVLRVFFTAAITAVVGLIALDFAGLIDFAYLYINPTFLGSAIVGGAIMGLGFILGGFCPGTSVVAASVGKLDAWIFILGSFIGIFLFGELYPLFKDFHMSGNLGPIFVYDSLGVSRGFFAFALVIIALAAFVVTDRLQRRVKYGVDPNHVNYKTMYPALAAGVVAAILVLIIPSGLGAGSVSAEDLEGKIQYVTADEAVFDIYKQLNKYQYIDLRGKGQYEAYCLTGAIRMNLREVAMRRYSSYFANRHKIPVFYCDNEKLARKAYAVAKGEGYDNVRVLKGGLSEFHRIIYDTPPAKNTSVVGYGERDFRLKARAYLNSDSTLTKPRVKKKVETKVVKVQGGC